MNILDYMTAEQEADLKTAANELREANELLSRIKQKYYGTMQELEKPVYSAVARAKALAARALAEQEGDHYPLPPEDATQDKSDLKLTVSGLKIRLEDQRSVVADLEASLHRAGVLIVRECAALAAERYRIVAHELRDLWQGLYAANHILGTKQRPGESVLLVNDTWLQIKIPGDKKLFPDMDEGYHYATPILDGKQAMQSGQPSIYLERSLEATAGCKVL